MERGLDKTSEKIGRGTLLIKYGETKVDGQFARSGYFRGNFGQDSNDRSVHCRDG